jgi:glucoamylase
MMEADARSLGDWADTQAQISAAKMGESVSATWLIKYRAGFGQTIRPAPGSVIAAIGSASDESEPDYFFHWLRDSAAVMDAALVLIGEGIAEGIWKEHFTDFVRFSLDLTQISGARFVAEQPDRAEHTLPELRQFLRSDAELAGIEGDRLLGDVRYNADCSIDFLTWSRPQHDGVATRALSTMRFMKAGAVPSEAADGARKLLGIDLDYTLRHAGEACVDIWEEENAFHYYTCLVQCAALHEGAAFARSEGNADFAGALASKAEELETRLEDFWSPERGFLLSRIMPPGRSTAKELDLAAILGVLHSGRLTGQHSIADPRVARTLEKLEELFAADYALNREAGAGLALGRYKNDVYFSGGAYFFCTFGAAEFYYKLAAETGDARLIAKGDAILEMARRSIPPEGDISEQFDQTTGEQTSAKNLTWSHGSFITCWHARKAALASRFEGPSEPGANPSELSNRIK